MAKNVQFHKRLKHVDIRYHFIREKVESEEIKLQYLCTQELLGDLFTKPLPWGRLVELRERIGLK